MAKWLMKKWRHLSLCGVHPDMSISEEKKVVLTNQLSIIFFVVLLMMTFPDVDGLVNLSLENFFSMLSIFPILIIPWSNSRGQTKYTGFIICVLTTFFTFLFSLLGQLSSGEGGRHLIQFIMPKMLGLSYLVLPFVLIDISNKKYIIICVAFVFFCLFCFDPILEYFHRGFFQCNVSNATYRMIPFAVFISSLFIVLSMVFMVGINTKYEQKIVSLVGELKDQNVILENNKTEISSQMETIQKSYSIIEQKNKNITDSIQYAKSIQASFLPSDDFIKEILPNSFVLYLPRDIVSGDFYWLKEIDGLKVIIAADCTGHGVPGAFVSILGSTLLNEIVMVRKILQPNTILDELRLGLKQAMKQTQDTKHKDGMDISICVFDPVSYQMTYAGANQTLIVCRAGERIEVKSDHQPVGIYVKERPFTQHQLQMERGDVFYIFSDGYQSQFGGESKEKMKSGRFKTALQSASSEAIDKQKDILETYLMNWKGALDQIDDVLVVGVKV